MRRRKIAKADVWRQFTGILLEKWKENILAVIAKGRLGRLATHRGSTFVRGLVAGLMLALALQAVWIYGIGMVITIPASQARPLSATLSRQLQREWPAVRATALKSIRPLVKAQVESMVNQVTVDIGGVRVALPPSLRQQMAMDINRAMSRNLDTYFSRHFNPGALISPELIQKALEQPMRLKVWVDVWRLPLPVTVQVGG
jgi:hypothetical protein